VWRFALIFFAALWSAAALIGWERMESYAYRPAAANSATLTWPKLDRDFLQRERTRIVVFAHPGCPCTRATLAELEEVLASCRGDICASIVFVTADLPPEVIKTSDTVAAAQQLKRVTVVFDERGELAARFGATVSGEAFVFNAADQRIFHGGITVGRGHRGLSPGRERLEQAINTPDVDAGSAPVFGCRLPTLSPLLPDQET
jgi:hypothetical protein